MTRLSRYERSSKSLCLKCSLWLGLAFFLCGCASDPKVRWSDEIQDAKAAGWPVLLYSIPFVAFPALAEIGVANTSTKEISRIDLKVTDCLIRSEYWDIILDGPIVSGDVSTFNATRARPGDPDEIDAGMIDKSPKPLWVNRVVITAIEVRFSDGSRTRFDGRDVSGLLGPKVPNYCPAGHRDQAVNKGDFVH